MLKNHRFAYKSRRCKCLQISPKRWIL